MEESSTNKLKQERKKRTRVARIKRMIVSIVSVWLLLSMGICTCLLVKVHSE